MNKRNKHGTSLATALGFTALALTSLVGCVSVNTDVSSNFPSTRSQDVVSPEQLPLNQFQFFGSHNSYKTALPAAVLEQLRQVNPQAAISLEYWHAPIDEQLDSGLRVLEFDVFYDPQQRLFELGGEFPVLHVQNLDTGSHCPNLRACMDSVVRWTEVHPDHEPIMISFNAKTDVIDRPGFIRPNAFDAVAWRALDALLRESLGQRVINPAQVLSPSGPIWPALSEARGKMLLVLDEGPEKHMAYLAAVSRPALFANLPSEDPRAAIRIINNPLESAAEIAAAVKQGFLVRTRADADTLEARSGDTTRRDAAFASGAHFVSTDYYQIASHFNSAYQVSLPGGGVIRCNPKFATRRCKALIKSANLLLKK